MALAPHAVPRPTVCSAAALVRLIDQANKKDYIMDLVEEAPPKRWSQLKKLFEDNGWKVGRISGSHHIFKKAGFRSIPVAFHGGTINPSYAKLVLQQLAKPFNAGQSVPDSNISVPTTTVVRGTKNPSVARDKRARMMHRSRCEEYPLGKTSKEEQETFEQLQLEIKEQENAAESQRMQHLDSRPGTSCLWKLCWGYRIDGIHSRRMRDWKLFARLGIQV